METHLEVLLLHGVSLESYTPFADVAITDNIFYNRDISIGAGPWNSGVTYNRIQVVGNQLYGGPIKVRGNPADTANSMKDISVVANSIIDSQEAGIYVSDILTGLQLD